MELCAGLHSSGLEKPSEVSGRSQGSTTNSLGETEITEEERTLRPCMVDCKRLVKIKTDQDRRLKMLRSRVDRLTAAERRVWKDVMWTQQMSLQAEEAQRRRQASRAEHLRCQQEMMAEEQVLRERAREMRSRASEMKDAHRLQRFQENQEIGRHVREESKQAEAALQEMRDQNLQSNVMQYVVRIQQRRQHQLRRDLERKRQEQEAQDTNALKYAELQEEIRNSEQAIMAAASEENRAMSRLKKSQLVRSDMFSLRQESENNGAASSSSTPSFSATGEVQRPAPRSPGSQSIPSRSASGRQPGLGQITEESRSASDDSPRWAHPPRLISTSASDIFSERA